MDHDRTVDYGLVVAVNRAKMQRFRDAVRRASGAPGRLRGESANEAQTLAWATEALRRLRRLIERVEKLDAGPRRDDAIRQLEVLRRACRWPTEDREAERERVNAAEAGQVKRVYRAVLPDIRKAKVFFSLYESLEQSDIDEHVAEKPRLARIAQALGMEWTVALVEELGAAKPSSWLISRLGERTNKSDSTIKNVLHRRHRRSK